MNIAALVSQTAAIASIMPATEILCRFDPEKKKPVVFITSRNFENGMIESWISGPTTEMSPLSYYHKTLPLSAADEVLLRNRFAKAMNDNNVQIRHRLPRTPREVPNRLARSVAAAVPATPEPAAAAPVPTQVAGLAGMSPEVRALLEQAAALQASQAQATTPTADPVAQFAQALQDAGAKPEQQASHAPHPEQGTPVKARTPRKSAAKKGGSRKPAAKPIGAIEGSTPAAKGVSPERALTMRRATDKPVTEAPSLEAKVDQLAAVVAALTNALGVKVEAGK